MTSASHAEGRQFDPGQVYLVTSASPLIDPGSGNREGPSGKAGPLLPEGAPVMKVQVVDAMGDTKLSLCIGYGMPSLIYA